MKNIKSHHIFFGLAFIGILVLTILVFLTKHQLSSDTNPKVNVELFYHYNHYLTNCNTLVFVILLFAANIIFIRQRYWDTFIWAGIIFLGFTLIDWWWLSELVFHYKKSNELWEGESNLGPFIGIIISILGLFIAVLNYFILKRFYKEKENNRNSDITEKIDKIG